MASKKTVRKTTAKKPLKTKTRAKKKAVQKNNKTKLAAKPTATKKKPKVSPSKKGTGVAKKIKKVSKPVGKKKASVKATPAKKKVAAKKVVSKKGKTIPKKKVAKIVAKPKSKKPAKKKAVVQKKTTAVAKKKVKSHSTKKPIRKSTPSSVPVARRGPKTKEPLFSSTERYNIGGLFACAIERRNDPDCTRFRAVLRHLDLYPQEKDNLIRLSEGFMIPKLFAENLPEPKVNQLLADLVKFAVGEGNYERYWREEIQQIGFWLGIFPAQFQAIEHQVKR